MMKPFFFLDVMPQAGKFDLDRVVFYCPFETGRYGAVSSRNQPREFRICLSFKGLRSRSFSLCFYVGRGTFTRWSLVQGC